MGIDWNICRISIGVLLLKVRENGEFTQAK